MRPKSDQRRWGARVGALLAGCAIAGAIAMLASAPRSGASTGTATIFVANSNCDSVTTYPAGASGNIAPLSPVTGLCGPAGVAFDSKGNIYVANEYGSTVTVYPAGSNGNAAPISVIGGSNTGLDYPSRHRAGRQRQHLRHQLFHNQHSHSLPGREQRERRTERDYRSFGCRALAVPPVSRWTPKATSTSRAWPDNQNSTVDGLSSGKQRQRPAECDYRHGHAVRSWYHRYRGGRQRQPLRRKFELGDGLSGREQRQRHAECDYQWGQYGHHESRRHRTGRRRQHLRRKCRPEGFSFFRRGATGALRRVRLLLGRKRAWGWTLHGVSRWTPAAISTSRTTATRSRSMAPAATATSRRVRLSVRNSALVLPYGIALDASGNIYVADAEGPEAGPAYGAVTVYPAGSGANGAPMFDYRRPQYRSQLPDRYRPRRQRQHLCRKPAEQHGDGLSAREQWRRRAEFDHRWSKYRPRQSHRYRRGCRRQHLRRKF